MARIQNNMTSVKTHSQAELEMRPVRPTAAAMGRCGIGGASSCRRGTCRAQGLRRGSAARPRQRTRGNRDFRQASTRVIARLPYQSLSLCAGAAKWQTQQNCLANQLAPRAPLCREIYLGYQPSLMGRYRMSPLSFELTISSRTRSLGKGMTFHFCRTDRRLGPFLTGWTHTRKKKPRKNIILNTRLPLCNEDLT